MGGVEPQLDLESDTDLRADVVIVRREVRTPLSFEAGRCVFCGGGPLTLEHVFPRWLAPVIETLGHPRSAVRLSEHGEHLHNIWDTDTIDFRVRRVCAGCNGGWMSELEAAAMPILTPLVQSNAAQTFTAAEAIVLSTWIAKTVLTASLMHPDETNPIPTKYFDEMYRGPAPFEESVIWIAAYDVGRYPASSSMVPIAELNGFRVTGNVGCLVYQLTATEGQADGGVVLPPGELTPYLTQVWPLEPRSEAETALHATLPSAWPAFGHLGRLGTAMNDDGLRFLAQIPDHSWGI